MSQAFVQGFRVFASVSIHELMRASVWGLDLQHQEHDDSTDAVESEDEEAVDRSTKHPSAKTRSMELCQM